MGRKSNRSARIRRKTRRTGFGRFLFRVLTFGVMLAAIAFAVTIFFKVQTVTLQGKTRYSAQEITTAFGVKQDDSLFFFGKAAGISRLRATFPYLNTIEVKRKLPDQVVITVTDSIPVACVSDGTATWLIDVKGKLLEQAAPNAACPLVTGITAPPTAVPGQILDNTESTQMLFLLLESLARSERIERVDFIDMTLLNSVHMGYDDRFDVKLGIVTGLDRKLRFLDALIDTKLSPSDICVIDLSVENTASTIPATKEEIAAANPANAIKQGDAAVIPANVAPPANSVKQDDA